MKRVILLSMFFTVVCSLSAQEPNHPPKPSAESKALKQTEMIVRELNITDTAIYHQLFDMHLRYARKYEEGCTRAQWLEQVESMNQELQQILTKEQYEAFMNKQVNEGPHGHKSQVGRFGNSSGVREPKLDKQQQQLQSQPQDLP